MPPPTPPIRLFATDLDETILGDQKSTERFLHEWRSLDAEQRPLLVYNTGRTVAATQWLVLERRVPVPEFVIGSLGTELHDPVDARAGADFQAHFAPGWDRSAVERIVARIAAARLQPPEFQNPWKASWHWHRASPVEVEHLRVELEQAGLEVSVLYTSSVHLDVIPRRAGKGHALAWLCRRVGVALENVLVAGVNANNAGMFALPGARGLLVGNTSRELFAATTRFKPLVASEQAAAGVLAGLRRFGLLDDAGVGPAPSAAGAA